MMYYSIGGKRSSLRMTVAIWLFCLSVVLYTLEMQVIDGITTASPDQLAGITNFLAQWPWLGVSLGGISAFAIFGILSWIFDRFIWKRKLIQRLTKIPDFSGIWKGVLKTSYDCVLEIPVTMIIKQSWNKISVVSTFPESESWSDSAHIEVEHTRGPLLKFTYANRATNPSWNDREHRGENELFLREFDATTKQYMMLRGDYYNNRGESGNVGSIILNRQNS